MGPVHVLSRPGTAVGKGFLWPRAHGVLRTNKDVPVVGFSAVHPSWPIRGEGPSMAGSRGCGDLEKAYGEFRGLF